MKRMKLLRNEILTDEMLRMKSLQEYTQGERHVQ